jgi:diguanylate cyclase (GGDEF)-like protein
MLATGEYGADFDVDIAAERQRLAQALVRAMNELESDRDEAHLLSGFADLLVTAGPHLQLAWFYIGAPDAEVIRPGYCAGAQREYGQTLAIDRSALMMRGPVRRALGEDTAVVQGIPLGIGPVARWMPGVRRWHRAALAAGVRAVLALPFSLPNRRDVGLVTIYADREHYFDAVGLEPFLAMSRLVQVGLDRIALRLAEARARDDIDRLRSQDDLTGLPNRAGTPAALAATLGASREPLLLLHLDIDDFGLLAASGGGALGDQVLLSVAAELADFTGDQGLVTRLGPDEFLAAMPLAEGESAEALVERCQLRLARPKTFSGRSLSLSTTVAATRAEAGDSGQVDVRLRELRLALDHARARGRGHRAFYDAAVMAGGSAPQDVLAGVRTAIVSDQLEIWYQPQVSLVRPGQPAVGLEALLRWRRPGQGLVSPASFIPAVERTELIRDVGCWVLDQVLDLAHRLQQRDLSYGVNIGARHLLHPRFLEDLDSLLSRHPDVPPACLEIEVTETAALDDPEAAVAVLRELRHRGFGVALDDFGTGHASLIHLRRLPVTRLKIDRAFVTGLQERPAERAIVEGLVIMARGLGLGLVAEGIETRAEADTLAELGCAAAQGYLFARPMPQTELRDWLGLKGQVQKPASGCVR